ncbi:hypothetical protein G7Y79_00030g064800 [Physcia stellaris]|nr:hypothetical protein G7Y79_00030g064800 [Physcia stellaris]
MGSGCDQYSNKCTLSRQGFLAQIWASRNFITFQGTTHSIENAQILQTPLQTLLFLHPHRRQNLPPFVLHRTNPIHPLLSHPDPLPHHPLPLAHLHHPHRHPPPRHKLSIFLVPLALNTVLALALLYRAYTALPTYFSILLATLGYDNPEKVHWKETEWAGLAGVAMERMGLFLLDYMLWAVVGGWPWEFFVGRKGEGEVGPVGWRWTVRFAEQEVVVRRSRRWDERLLARAGDAGMKVWASDGEKVERDEEGVMRERIMPAVAPAWVRGKTGYAMLDKSWDLDFGAMVRAHGLVAAPLSGDAITIDAFRTTVLVYEHGKGWLAWPVWKLEESQGGEQEAQRRKIVQMKDRLTAMGKENLFFAWVEMVQFESSAHGGFTVERQRVAVEKARRMFEAQGVDFEDFWAEIEGGVEGMMGMEVVK